MSKKEFRQNIANWKSSPLGKTSKVAVEGLENLAAYTRQAGVTISGAVSEIVAELIAGGETYRTELFRSTGSKGGQESAKKRKIPPETLARWQSKADAYWVRHPNASAKRVGRDIAEAGDKPDTIRRMIKKPH